jgi:hypothetical protein
MTGQLPESREAPRQSAARPPVLRLYLDEEVLFEVGADEVPVEKLPVVQLTRAGQALRFIDSEGAARTYDLSSIYEEGERFLHLSVSVRPTFVVQADALFTKDGKNPGEVVQGLGGRGVRLEPFYLPECDADPADLIGRGLFYRGLHFPGIVTRGNVSLLCICDRCRKSFRLQSFHAGFSDLTYLYCSKQPHTLVASSYLEDAPPVLGGADAASVARFESRLPPCEQCGGEFRYMNPLRCPHCLGPYIDFERHPADRANEYYGNYLYGGALQRWEPHAETR